MAAGAEDVVSVTANARLEKLRLHQEQAPQAVRDIIDWLRDEPELIAAAALGRHAEGSIRFGDRLMYELTPDELEAEALQELADAVNYLMVRRQKLG